MLGVENNRQKNGLNRVLKVPGRKKQASSRREKRRRRICIAYFPGVENTRQMNGRPTDASNAEGAFAVRRTLAFSCRVLSVPGSAGAPEALASCPKDTGRRAIEPRNLLCDRDAPLSRVIYCAVAPRLCGMKRAESSIAIKNQLFSCILRRFSSTISYNDSIFEWIATHRVKASKP